ncbi:DsbA family protein [Cellulomonas denverensis]|uniref:Thioredoxin domain-containing protein n=1 Tax=Cellulomonas denverensis TaxID=264297 RepID=A0A7X6QY30_9CELL|nr:thioredoxin domain-containing protein [Cellulomonas denverensis]NKY21698.1 thioredoxin domain-containing protein [Cellulomonas denverensis]GIG25644.1 hypothetical protein Cde04nite_18880 [Cellulomonas denverensis]
MSQRQSMLFGGAIAVAVMAVIALVVVLVVLPGSGSADVADPVSVDPGTAGATMAVETPTAADFARNDPDDPMAIGDIDAPVLMIEWADLRCHYCGQFANETLPGLLSDYVEDGTLRIEWHSAVVLGGTSGDAAVAARAAGQQGLFWEFVEALYATEPTGETVWDRAALTALAAGVPGLDAEQFAADLDDPDLIAAAEEEADASRRIGVESTPTFVVGDQVLRGAQPLENFATVIQDQMA